jgi:nucleoside-diphosphate-sugar epimerase
MMFEKVLITGASGRVGEYVCAALRSRCRLTATDLATDASREVGRLDVSDRPALLAAMRDQDAVVHLAAVTEHPVADMTLNVNARGTWNVLAAAEAQQVQKVVIMSSEAGLGMEYLDWDSPPLYLSVDEQHPFRPMDFYGLSKHICETVAQTFARRRTMEIVCLRPVEVAFPSVIEDLLSRLAQERDAGVRAVTRTRKNPAGLAISRAYVRPDDLVAMIALALEANLDAYEVFWASAPDTYAPQATLELLTQLFGVLPPIRTNHYAHNKRASVFDITAARRRLGWEPTGDWKQAVSDLTGRQLGT